MAGHCRSQNWIYPFYRKERRGKRSRSRAEYRYQFSHRKKNSSKYNATNEAYLSSSRKYRKHISGVTFLECIRTGVQLARQFPGKRPQKTTRCCSMQVYSNETRHTKLSSIFKPTLNFLQMKWLFTAGGFQVR